MELDEMIAVLKKLHRVGLARCEGCNSTMKFSEAIEIRGSLLCPECLKKSAWGSENTIELQAD